MKCNECEYDNIVVADYCQDCGNPFTEEEKQEAHNKTIFGWIDKGLDWWGKLNLSFITGNRYVRIAVLAVLILYCVVVTAINGNKMRILDSIFYNVEYNEEYKEYYVLTNKDAVALKLYIPNKFDVIYITETDSYGYTYQNIYDSDDEIILEKSSYPYLIQTDTQEIEVYVVDK